MRCVLLAVLLVGCGGRGDGPGTPKAEETKPLPPAASGIPADWTHKELVDHLRQNGVDVVVHPAPFLSREGVTDATLAPVGGGPGRVIALLCRDEKAAREQAGALGDGATHSGRFAFGRVGEFKLADVEADKALLARVTAALP